MAGLLRGFGGSRPTTMGLVSGAVRPTAASAPMAEPEPDGDEGLISPEDAGYTDAGQSCGLCQYFEAPNVCRLVSGPKVESGWCKLYAEGGSGDEMALAPESVGDYGTADSAGEPAI